MLIRYIIYGLLGWNMEVLWTGLTSFNKTGLNLIGHTSVWMFFVYGLACLLEPVHTKIVHLNWFIRGLIWMVLIFSIEFVTGYILRLFGISAWTYDGKFSVRGLIRLDYAPLWFAVGLLFEKVHFLLLSYNIGIK